MAEPYIPSDLSEKVLVTSFLSSFRHLPILGSVWTTLVIKMKSMIPLRAFIVEGHLRGCQRLQNVPDIDLGPTGNTNA